MVLDWIYNNPTWLWGTIVVGLFTGSACVGLLIFQRLVHLEVRRAHNELAGFTVAVISVTMRYCSRLSRSRRGNLSAIPKRSSIAKRITSAVSIVILRASREIVAATSARTCGSTLRPWSMMNGRYSKAEKCRVRDGNRCVKSMAISSR
jgi:hypothetical protein